MPTVTPLQDMMVQHIKWTFPGGHAELYLPSVTARNDGFLPVPRQVFARLVVGGRDYGTFGWTHAHYTRMKGADQFTQEYTGADWDSYALGSSLSLEITQRSIWTLEKEEYVFCELMVRILSELKLKDFGNLLNSQLFNPVGWFCSSRAGANLNAGDWNYTRYTVFQWRRAVQHWRKELYASDIKLRELSIKTTKQMPRFEIAEHLVRPDGSTPTLNHPIYKGDTIAMYDSTAGPPRAQNSPYVHNAQFSHTGQYNQLSDQDGQTYQYGQTSQYEQSSQPGQHGQYNQHEYYSQY